MRLTKHRDYTLRPTAGFLGDKLIRYTPTEVFGRSFFLPTGVSIHADTFRVQAFYGPSSSKLFYFKKPTKSAVNKAIRSAVAFLNEHYSLYNKHQEMLPYKKDSKTATFQNLEDYRKALPKGFSAGFYYTDGTLKFRLMYSAVPAGTGGGDQRKKIDVKIHPRYLSKETCELYLTWGYIDIMHQALAFLCHKKPQVFFIPVLSKKAMMFYQENTDIAVAHSRAEYHIYPNLK